MSSILKFEGNDSGGRRTPASEHEPFVDADVVAEFLSVERRMVLDWARAGVIPGHPLGFGCRRIWRFRISEVVAAVLKWKKPVRSTIPSGSLRGQRSKSNG